MKNYIYYILIILGLLFLPSCSSETPIDVEHSFKSAIITSQEIKDFNQVQFKELNDLNLGFFKGNIWIKLDVENKNEPASLIVLCNDLINRNYRFYKLNKKTNKLITKKETNLKKDDHRTFNYAKPNFLINLKSDEKATFYIQTFSDGRILQASPKLISLNKFQELKQQSLLFDIIFYVAIVIIIIINLIYFQVVKNTIYYFYGAYILSSCLMYLFVEGRIYGLGIEHSVVDHMMFISIRIWVFTAVLFTVNFLETKLLAPKFYQFIKVVLILTLGLSTVYQVLFYSSSISTLHKAENIIGFMWIILSLLIVRVSFNKRKEKSTYYLISYLLLLFFITIGLIDSHANILPGDPFSYFKIGTLLEFIGFTYFIALLIKNKLKKTNKLENELLINTQELSATSEKLIESEKRLSSQVSVKKTDLISVLKLVENSLSTEEEWDDFKTKFKELNQNFHKKLIANHPNLTKSEIRLLTLIQVGYSQKEIAGILNIAPDSVKKAKSRVRKKLSLNDSIILNEYLESISHLTV